MRKRITLIMVSLLLLLSMLVTSFACAQAPAPTPTPSPTSKGSPSPTSEQVINVRFAAGSVPSTHWLISDVFSPWEKAVLEKSQGKVKLTFLLAGAIGPSSQSFDLTRDGIVDLAISSTQQVPPGVFPYTGLLALPMGPYGKLKTQAISALWDKYFKQGFTKGDVTVYSYAGIDPIAVWLRTKRVTSPDDLKGLKMWTDGTVQAKVLQNIGAVPTTLDITQMSTSLAQGIIDGTLYGVSGGWGQKLYESSKYLLDIGFGSDTFLILMNKKWFEALPKNVQQALSDSSPMLNELLYTKYVGRRDGFVKDFAKMEGKELLTPSAQDMQAWLKYGTPAWNEWVDQAEKAGLPGKQLMSEFKAFLKKEGFTPPGD